MNVFIDLNHAFRSANDLQDQVFLELRCRPTDDVYPVSHGIPAIIHGTDALGRQELSLELGFYPGITGHPADMDDVAFDGRRRLRLLAVARHLGRRTNADVIVNGFDSGVAPRNAQNGFSFFFRIHHAGEQHPAFPYVRVHIDRQATVDTNILLQQIRMYFRIFELPFEGAYLQSALDALLGNQYPLRARTRSPIKAEMR